MGLEDEIKSPVKGFFSRLDHPIFGAFAFSWLVFNWDVLYLIFMGREKYLDTITTVWNDYIFSPTNHRTFLIPAAWTAFYLVAGPAFSTGYKVLVKWIEAWILKVDAVPKYEMTRISGEMKAAEKEKDFHIQAYNMVRNTADPEQLLVNLQRQVRQFNDRENAYQKEVAVLRADKVVAVLGRDVELIKAENVAITRAKYGLVEIANAFLEFKTKHLLFIREALSQGKGKAYTAAAADDVLAEINRLSELIRQADMPGVRQELLPKPPKPTLVPTNGNKRSVQEVADGHERELAD